MPYVVTCPECSTRLKTPNPVPAGRAVTCPQCRHAFTTTEVSPELADTASAPALPRPPVPPPPPKKARQEELATAEIVDDDENDRPRSKKRRDDDEDDRPRAKKRRDDDEDDRPPAKKRSRDDEDDLPAARRKGPKKKKSKLVLILAIALPLLFLMVAGAGVGAYFLFFGGGPSTDMLAWAPSDTEMVEGVNYAKISAYPKLKRPVQARLGRIEDIGVPLTDVDEALFATGLSGSVTVVRTKSKLDAPALMGKIKATELTAGGKKYYRAQGGYYHAPAARLLVYTPAESTMTALLKKEEKVTIGDELRGYANKAGGDTWAANTSRTPFGLAPLGGFMAPKGSYGGNRALGNQIKITRTLVFADTAAAQAAESQFKLAEQMFKSGGRGKGLESISVTSSGSTVTLTATGSIEDDGGTLFGGF